MNKKKIILVNSVGKTADKNKIYLGGVPPSAASLEYIASTLETNGYSSEIFYTITDENNLLSSIETLRPIAVGFSVYTYSYKYGLSLAKAAKQKAANLGYHLFTIFGGYHVACLPKDAISEEAVDFVAKGESELLLCQLMDELNTSQNFEKIKGLYFKKDGKIVENPPAERISDLDSIPLPKRNEKLMYVSREERNLGYPPASLSGNSAWMLYSRGCPFSCSFCTSKDTWGNKVFWRSPKSVVDEIEMLYKEHQVKHVAFIDLTFNASRQKVIELCDEMIKRDLPIVWGAMVRLDLLDEELLNKMSKAKCVKFNLGIESPIDSLANSVKDNYHTKAYRQHEILNAINDNGITTRAFLIIGFPNDTKELLDKYVEAIKYFPANELRVTIATPFPGTSLWEECIKKDLIPKPIPWEKFTTAEPILIHPHLSDEDIYYYREKLITTFFFSDHYKKHITKLFKKFPKYRLVWKEYFEYIKKIGVFNKYEKELNLLIDCINKGS